MSTTSELAQLARRLEQVENALADAQARVPGLRLEVCAIREALRDHADSACASYAAGAGSPAADAAASS